MNACHHTFVPGSIIRNRRQKPRVPCVLWGMMIYRSLTVTNVPVALGRDADGERGTLLAAPLHGEPRTARKQSTALMRKRSPEYSKLTFPGHCTRSLLPPELLMCIWSCVIGTREMLPSLPLQRRLAQATPIPWMGASTMHVGHHARGPLHVGHADGRMYTAAWLFRFKKSMRNMLEACGVCRCALSLVPRIEALLSQPLKTIV